MAFDRIGPERKHLVLLQPAAQESGLGKFPLGLTEFLGVEDETKVVFAVLKTEPIPLLVSPQAHNNAGFALGEKHAHPDLLHPLSGIHPVSLP